MLEPKARSVGGTGENKKSSLIRKAEEEVICVYKAVKFSCRPNVSSRRKCNVQEEVIHKREEFRIRLQGWKY